MAPSLPLCLSNAFCSHRQASCLLLVALIPFFSPLLILSVPFMLLFLAPLCCLLFSLLLLYKVQVSIGSRYPCIRRKGAFWAGFEESSSLDVDEEGRRSQVLSEFDEELDGANAQSVTQQGMLASDLEASSQSESSEADEPFETASSSTQGPSEDVESEDKIQVVRKILADIYAIRKIVGYYGEAHASVTEQITALYRFLGMGPYEWDEEVDELDRARAEIELLKLVVGVK